MQYMLEWSDIGTLSKVVFVHSVLLIAHKVQRVQSEPADINDGWIRYVQTIHRGLLDAGNSTPPFVVTG